MGSRTRSLSTPVLHLDGIEFEATWYGLKLSVTDYQAGPVLLRPEHLADLGLRVERQGELCSQVARGAKASDPLLERLGLENGGLLIIPVREGLDVFVTCYQAEGVRLWEARLRRLGLALASRGGVTRAHCQQPTAP